MIVQNPSLNTKDDNVINVQQKEDINIYDKKVKFSKTKANLLLILFCFVVAFLFLMICSQNSFLYTINCFPDLNFYVTMGKCINAGRVPYKDVFDHKGPLLYFIFSCFTWLKNPYIGVFILEIISTTAFLFFAYKICNRYIGKYASLIAVIIIATITISSSYNYAGGGAVEEFCLPLITYLFLCFLELAQDKKQFTKLRSVVIGIALGIMFWIKFTMLVSAIFVMLYWLIVTIKYKQVKQLFVSIGFMLIGFAIITGVSLFYYVIHGALKDVFYVYFYLNIFKYNSAKVGVVFNLFKIFLFDYFSFALMMISIPLAFIHNKKSFAWTYVLCLIFNIVSISVQYCYIYYYIQLFPFVVFSVAMILKMFKKIKTLKIIQAIVVVGLTVLCLSSSFVLCGATAELGKGKQDYAQFKLAQDISAISKDKNIQNPSLFCYQMYDCGFHYATGILPSVKYFVKCNFSKQALPEMYESFDDVINQQQVDFIICEKVVYNQNQELQNNYQLYNTYKLNQYSNIVNDTILDVVLLVNKASI